MSIIKETVENIGIVLLAAGNSVRLGQPKQLLIYKGETLLRRSIKAALTSQASPVVLVTGAAADLLKSELEGTNVQLIENVYWQEGMASSIRLGLSALLEINPRAEGLILMVCDQPHITSDILNRLIETYRETGKPIIASGYAGTYGPPTFFHNSTFSELLQLKGDVGARSVVREHSAEVEVISFPEGEIDIDTEDDYRSLSKDSHGNDKRLS